MSDWLLDVQDLRMEFQHPAGPLRALDGLSFTLAAGRTLGLVGESGGGKSALARSLLRVLPDGGRITGGRVMFEGRDLCALSEAQMQQVRGRAIAMIFQDPLTSLNPVLTIGRQIEQVLLQHTGLPRAAAAERAVELLAAVGLPAPRECARSHAHRLSGGMRQRAVIAIALACQPRLLIADEPTSALDVTVQAQILALLRQLQLAQGMALLLISHDVGVIRQMCDDVAVLYAGRIVEQGRTADLMAYPRMHYTQALLQSVPRLDHPPHRRLPVIEGQPPNPLHPPPGCRFAPRCASRSDPCHSLPPPMSPAGPHHFFACWHPVAVAGTPA